MFYLILILVSVAVATLFFYAWDPVSDALERSVFRQRAHVTKELEQMFIFVSVDKLQRIKWAVSIGLAFVVFLLAWDTPWPAPVVLAGLFAVLGYWMPEIVLIYMRHKRRRDFSDQLVDGLVLMASGLRSGYTLEQAIEMLIKEMPAPISQEFELVRREWVVLHLDVDQALRNCVGRTKDEDLDLVVTAIQITRQLGGNLPEVFDRIVAMVRERKILKGKALALTAEGRLQAIVVGLLPLFFGLIMVKVDPERMKLMWTTMPGVIASAVVVTLDVIGFFWVRKAGNIEY